MEFPSRVLEWVAISVHGISLKSTGVGCHFLLQGIFPTQELNSTSPVSSPLQADSLPIEPSGKPKVNIRCIVNEHTFKFWGKMKSFQVYTFKKDRLYFSEWFWVPRKTEEGTEISPLLHTHSLGRRQHPHQSGAFVTAGGLTRTRHHHAQS